MNQQEIDKYGAIAESAVSLFRNNDFSNVASEFGYALKYDREAAIAIEEDLRRASDEIGVSLEEILATEPEITIKKFKDGDMFDVLVEISFVHQTGGLLVEMIKQNVGKLYLEDISTFT